jgi:hypothetical protein
MKLIQHTLLAILTITAGHAFPHDEPVITTIYDRDGFTVYYPAGKANEWSAARTDYGHSRTTLDDVKRAGRVSRDTTDALLNGGSVIDAAFPDL